VVNGDWSKAGDKNRKPAKDKYGKMPANMALSCVQ
jgi:hypothetical protein